MIDLSSLCRLMFVFIHIVYVLKWPLFTLINPFVFFFFFWYFDSQKITVKVKCHHPGCFKTEGGVLSYGDGIVDVLEVDSLTIFEDVVMYLVAKDNNNVGRMWYKLPYEDMSDRIPLWENVEENKKKLVAKARWMGEVDIYFEKPIQYSINEEVTEAANKEARDTATASKKASKVAGVKVKKKRKVVTKEIVCEDEDSDGQKSDAGLSESSDSDMEADIAEEEAVNVEEEEIAVFNSHNYEEQIPDEDEVYPATDDESGDEEAQAERLVKRGLPDGVFSLRQVFCSGIDFKKNVVKYVLKTRRNVFYDRWEKERLGARCKGKGCSWKVYCAVENPIGKWMVKTYFPDHQCHPTGRCEIIKTPVIANLFLEDIRRDPAMSGPEIKDEMKRQYNIIISPNQAKVARRRVFDKLQAECDNQFARLRDYEQQLLESNLHTTVEINTTTRADGSEAFHQMYICFEALRTAWKQNCRPIIGLDRTFLKNSMKGMMLTVVGRDPNNQIFPIAWAVVDCENNPNWEWFVGKLKRDLGLGLGENITLISDMHRGLIHGISTELPMAEHRACARHIYSNLKKNHKADMLKPLFLQAVTTVVIIRKIWHFQGV
ncbi:uncharacterized protein LOC110229723 [Arabidopsis lyrata subsp. lyrata]|uniref:uncharacterized protein LOC110229723 n=1 Tax=Arabidopsis lyrata subsp. lyrata TaxID=81972 RepID=UPI000A29D8BB|nr:uncharacterized protein LOC110229723 [Arabidopsis lyrata subsp. lyrata]|eukprot:XP_020886130.1 uncharacterized protein LOC110229723 [Arabidopsis lyrata subsp. lyrata]